MRRIVLATLLITVMLFSSATPAMAEWIQHPVTGEYWYCDYYGSEYWCWIGSAGIWTRAAPGWQHGALGG